MGASCDEVVADYMVTYYNYYGVTPDDARYQTIANSNIVKSLERAFAVADLRTADLAASAAAYLRRIGMSDAELAALRTNLSAASASAANVPASAANVPASGGTDYVVVRGDCLWNLAYRFYGTGRLFGRIAEANGVRPPYVIYVGQTLTIPAR